MNSSSPKPLLSLVIVWVLLLPLLVFASEYGFSFQRGAANNELNAATGVTGVNDPGSSVVRFQNFAVYGICAVIVAPVLGSIVAGFANDLLLTALLTLAFGSALWSQNAHISLVTSIYLALNMALAFYLLQRFSREDLMKLFMTLGAVAALGTLVMVALFPQYGLQFRGGAAEHGAWEGIFGHKNICGEVFTYLLTPAFFVRLSGRYASLLRYGYIFTLLFIIAMTRSAGAWAICIGTLATIAAIRLMARMKGMNAAVIVLCGSVAVIAAVFLALNNFDALLHVVGKDPTLTGRTVIWAHLFVSILKRPWTGYGYMAFWTGMRGESANIAIAMNWPGIAYAENGLLELCLFLGLLGVGLFLLLFGRAIRDGIYCFRRNPSPEVMWFITILAFTVFSNIEAGKLLYPSDLECILQYIAIIGLRQQRKQIREAAFREPVTA